MVGWGKNGVQGMTLLYPNSCYNKPCTSGVEMHYFVLVFFSPLSIAITSLGGDRANLRAFRAFVRFVLVCFCLFLFPLVSEKGCGL